MKEKIWLSSPHMSGNEQRYVQEAFDTNWIAPLGPNVNAFEQELVTYTKAKNATVLVSGTAAIHLALILLGVQKDDVVLAPTFTFSATINPIRYQNAIPVLIDSEKETWNMDPALLEQAIKENLAKNKKPKAIIVVHLYGMPAKMNEILTVAAQYDIPVIEDAAESLGATYYGKQTGTMGALGIFSFNGNKIITTSGGGALVTQDKNNADRALFLATQAREDAPHYQHNVVGYNYRMSNVVAGIGRGQLEVLDERIAARRANFMFYKNALKELPISFQDEPKGFHSNRWLTTIVTASFEKREAIRLALAAENIEARPLWKPMHLQPVFEKFPTYLNDISETLFEKGLCLPSGSNLSENDLNRIVACIKAVF